MDDIDDIDGGSGRRTLGPIGRLPVTYSMQQTDDDVKETEEKDDDLDELLHTSESAAADKDTDDDDEEEEKAKPASPKKKSKSRKRKRTRESDDKNKDEEDDEEKAKTKKAKTDPWEQKWGDQQQFSFFDALSIVFQARPDLLPPAPLQSLGERTWTAPVTRSYSDAKRDLVVVPAPEPVARNGKDEKYPLTNVNVGVVAPEAVPVPVVESKRSSKGKEKKGKKNCKRIEAEKELAGLDEGVFPNPEIDEIRRRRMRRNLSSAAKAIVTQNAKKQSKVKQRLAKQAQKLKRQQERKEAKQQQEEVEKEKDQKEKESSSASWIYSTNPCEAWNEYCCLTPHDKLSFVDFESFWTKAIASRLDNVMNANRLNNTLLACVRLGDRWKMVKWIAWKQARVDLPAWISDLPLNVKQRLASMHALASTATLPGFTRSFFNVLASWFAKSQKQTRQKKKKGQASEGRYKRNRWRDEMNVLIQQLAPAHATELCVRQTTHPQGVPLPPPGGAWPVAAPPPPPPQSWLPMRPKGWTNNWLFYTLEYGSPEDTRYAITHGYFVTSEMLAYLFWRPAKHDHLAFSDIWQHDKSFSILGILLKAQVAILDRKRSVDRFLSGKRVQEAAPTRFLMEHFHSWISMLYAHCNWFLPCSPAALLAMNATFLIHSQLSESQAEEAATYVIWSTHCKHVNQSHQQCNVSEDGDSISVNVPVEWLERDGTYHINQQQLPIMFHKCTLPLPESLQIPDDNGEYTVAKDWLSGWTKRITLAFERAALGLVHRLLPLLRDHGKIPAPVARMICSYCFVSNSV